VAPSQHPAPDATRLPAPHKLPPTPDVQPIATPSTVLVESVQVEPPEKPQPAAPQQPQPAAAPRPKADAPSDSPSDGATAQDQAPSKPWLLTLFGLFASLGGNVYLLWVAFDFRSRYRTLARRSRATSDGASSEG